MGVALGVEARRETAKATPDENRSGDFVGLLASTMDGGVKPRPCMPSFACHSFPKLELGGRCPYRALQHLRPATCRASSTRAVAADAHHDVPGSMATGFRPSISQQQAVALAFTSSGYYDPLRCDRTGATPKSGGARRAA